MQGVPAQAKELNTMFLGKATLTNSACAQYLQAGLEALEQRIYFRAVAQLSKAVAEFRKRNVLDATSLMAKVSLGQALLGNGQNDTAEKIFLDCAGRARDLGDTRQHAKALTSLATISAERADFKRAQTY